MIICTLLLSVVILPFCSAAHYIVGYVENAVDGEIANGKIVTLWNPLNGQVDNLTDLVGPSGNSGTDNIYFIDCEALSTPCVLGDTLSLKIFNGGDNYLSNEVNLTVAGLGFDQASNLTLNSPPQIISVEIEDDLTFPLNEIDLVPATTKTLTCSAILNDVDNETEIKNASATFFDIMSSAYLNPDDKNNHYTNNSCELNQSYGTNKESFASCNIVVEYYANAGDWNCTITVGDIYDRSSTNSDSTIVNGLLAIGVDSPLNYGIFSVGAVSDEMKVNVTNYGNVQINLSLSGYGETLEDGKAMNCTLGEGIPIYYEKYNLTTSNPGNLTLSEFENTYTNLSSSPIVKTFNLNRRENDVVNDASSDTYWRIYVPSEAAGNCSGNLIFGATQGQEI